MSHASRALLAFAAISLSGCFLPPDPPAPASEPSSALAVPSDAGRPTVGGGAADDSLVDGAWRPADPPERSMSGASLTPGVASALSVGTWSARVEPPGSEQLPDVSLWLRDLVLPGDAAGSAEYRFDGYRCRYSLYVEKAEGNTVRLRQRLESGRCAGPGRIILAWEDGESLVGDWVRPDGSPWFRARLSRAPDVSAVPDGGSGGASGGQGPERVP